MGVGGCIRLTVDRRPQHAAGERDARLQRSPGARAGARADHRVFLADTRAATRRDDRGTATESRHRRLQLEPRASAPPDPHDRHEGGPDTIDAAEHGGAGLQVDVPHRSGGCPRRTLRDGRGRLPRGPRRVSFLRREIDLGQARPQRVDGANGQTLRRVFGVGLQHDVRNFCSTFASLVGEDPDVDAGWQRVVADVDDRVDVAFGGQSFQPGARFDGRRARRRRPFDDRQLECERQNLTFQPRHGFVQLGRCGGGPHDEDLRGLGARGREGRGERRDERQQEMRRAIHGTDLRRAFEGARRAGVASCRKAQEIRARDGPRALRTAHRVREDHLSSEGLGGVRTPRRLGQVVVIPGDRLLFGPVLAHFLRPPEQEERVE